MEKGKAGSSGGDDKDGDYNSDDMGIRGVAEYGMVRIKIKQKQRKRKAI